MSESKLDVFNGKTIKNIERTYENYCEEIKINCLDGSSIEICAQVGHGLIYNCKNIKEDIKLNYNEQKEFVIVPQSDINKLEKARLYLFKIIENNSFLLSKILFDGISDIMWKITHRKYKKLKNENNS